MPFNIDKVWEALYAINRAIEPDPTERSDLQEKLISARDKVWAVLCEIDPTIWTNNKKVSNG